MTAKYIQNQKFVDITGPDCKLQTKIPKDPIFLNSRNFTKLSILASEMNSENIRPISKRLNFYRTIYEIRKKLSVNYKAAHKMRASSRAFSKYIG